MYINLLLITEATAENSETDFTTRNSPTTALQDLCISTGT